MPTKHRQPIQPGDLDHPCHDEQWMELARVLGRAMADLDFNRQYGKGKPNENRRHLRKVLKRPAKRSVD